MLREIVTHRNLLWNLVKRDLRGRYIGSIIGIFWSVINPLLLMLMYIVIFSVILKVKFAGAGGVANYGLYLFCGMLPWMAFSDALQRSTMVILDNSNLIKKVVFPRSVLPCYLLLVSFINELIAAALFIGILFIMGQPPGVYILGFLVIFPIQLIFTFGLSLLVSSLNVFFRDMAPLVACLLILWFFATPIVYPLPMVPGRLARLININPMTALVTSYRAILLENKMPNLNGLLFFLGVSILVFLVGYTVFNKTKQEFADVI